MKVTSEDIRNLAEALPRVKKHMDTGTFINLCDCVELAIEKFKKRLELEDDETCTLDEVMKERDIMNDLADTVRKVNELSKKIDDVEFSFRG